MNYAVPIGRVKVVVFDDRPQSPTYQSINEFFLSADNYFLLTIPPNLWYGFKAEGDHAAMIVNCSTIPHDPAEMLRRDSFDSFIPYSWEKP
jgi:dTDP-4-dehydrorhamnose 3,5-epimerase